MRATQLDVVVRAQAVLARWVEESGGDCGVVLDAGDRVALASPSGGDPSVLVAVVKLLDQAILANRLGQVDGADQRRLRGDALITGFDPHSGDDMNVPGELLAVLHQDRTMVDAGIRHV